ncbi:MAG TPA: hypothetical protein VKH13_11955 [Steroidobacteraceae bacterium]|nr:hypothetical protein [Steroidobacteraceae bacterium]
MRSSMLKIVAAAGVTLFLAAPSWADNPGKHPAYLHALSDLRDARAHLEQVSSDAVAQEAAHAIEHINKAIGEIKKAAIMDGKNIQDHAPVDAQLARTGRFHKSLELLDKARHDVSGEEDQPDTMGLQQRVIHQIEEARHSVQHAIDILSHS